MIVVAQRVSKAKVKVGKATVANIGQGLLLLVGFCKKDSEKIFDKVVKKIVKLRIFPDEKGKMNQSLLRINGELLIVPQFTLCSKIKSGCRPSFSNAAEPKVAQELFEKLVRKFELVVPRTFTGKFREYMKVSLTNDGPVTFVLEF